MSVTSERLEQLPRRFSHAIVSWLDRTGYPVSVATGFEVDARAGVVRLDPVTGRGVTPPKGREVNVSFSHIRPQPGVGYDERRWVTLWGTLRQAKGKLELTPTSAQGWDEQELAFFEYNERTVPQALRYFDQLSRERGTRVKPKLAFGWLFLRATRLPFITATAVPILLGIAIAANEGHWRWPYAVLTLIGGIFIHLGLNVANDVFDTMSGADQANTTPTQFSGGSRVILYGLLSMRTMALMSAGFFGAGMAIGLYLALARGFWPLVAIGAVGMFIAISYTAPPLRLVHRGLGEIAVGLGFGPVMSLGAYYVQAQRLSWEAAYASLPVAVLIALVLYVNEIPDRAGDARAGKRTLPVRLSKEAVVRGYDASVAVAYLLIVLGALTGVLPFPAILALATIPLWRKVSRGIREHYESPYTLMPVMGVGVNLHLFTGLLLFLGYVIAIVAGRNLADAPGVLTHLF